MQQSKAILKYLRISPRKVRLVADLIRGQNVQDAEQQLLFSTKRAAKPVLKLLKSAIANAGNLSNLYIAEIRVDQGPTLKRWRARARGRAAMIKKRTSHITIKLEQCGTKSKS